MKIIVAHPGRQHSFRLASALKKSGNLAYYCTSVYDKDTSLLMRLTKRFLSEDNLKRANKRKNPDLADRDVVQICEIGGLLETLLYRVDNSKVIYEKVRNIDADIFGVKVAKLAIKENADAVVMYDSNATKGFKYLKKNAPHIKRILDVSIGVRPYLKGLYQAEIDKTGYRDLYNANKPWWNDKMIRKLQAEIDDAQYFLAASSFVEESLIACGVKKEQILRVPYGANVSSDTIHTADAEKPLNLLYVGQVTYRKGITHLLEAVSQMNPKDVRLTVVGAYNKEDWFVKKYENSENVTFTGLVTPDKMADIYAQSEVFVIDSIAEGMAQVGIEAMACGLAVICSHNSGIDDLVEEEKNGFVIPCCDVNALKEKIDFFVKSREKAIEMGENGREIAKEYTWENYEKSVVSALLSIE